MTKQGVIVPEGVPGVRYPPPRPGSTHLKSKVSSKLEVGVGRRISSWVESMRASSPTHVRKCDEKTNNWMTDHPSALGMFEEIVKASLGKQIVMFLDYDGTLSPIVEDPDKAFMSDAMRAAVSDVARCFPTAIVSGRCRDKVFNFVRLGGLYYAGSHGMDIEGPRRSKGSEAVNFQAAGEYLPMIDEVYTALVDKMENIEGAKVENNKYCLSVHFRRVDEKRWSSVAEQVRSVLKNYPKLHLTQGRKVLEIRPTIKWDKGKALEFLLETLGFASCNKVLPVYIGDDRTDEDAFRMLKDRGQGFGILVSKMPRDTSASYTLQEPSEVKDFLHRLVKWKTLLLPSPVEV